MEAMQALLTRRSTRRYKQEMPERELIEKVVNAGRHAPSGSNSQTKHFFVISDSKIMKDLADLVQKAFSHMEISDDTYISIRNAVNASKKGGYVFHYNAPVLIVTANRKGYGNAMADSACAL